MVSDTVLNICFHGVGDPQRDLEPGEGRYWIQEQEFYRILDEIAGWPSVRISFDDGNRSDLRIGLPALSERDLTATFFVLAGRFGKSWSLDRDAVRELYRSGMAVGTHGMDHRRWRGMSPLVRDRELIEARELISEVISTPVTSAALPLGQYDRRVLKDLRRLRYTRVFSSDRRPAHGGAWLQPRYSVRHDDTAQTMRANVLTPMPLVNRVKAEAKGLLKTLR